MEQRTPTQHLPAAADPSPMERHASHACGEGGLATGWGGETAARMSRRGTTSKP